MKIKKPGDADDSASSEKIDSTIGALLEKAAARHATDVHIEPRERNVVVRFRIDGLLSEAAKLPLDTLRGILRNLKMRAGLNPKQIRAPQQGECTFASKQFDVVLRIATMPTVNGEKATIHLAPKIGEPATLESLGFWGDMLANIEREIAEPHGLIVASSPNSTGANMSLLGIVHLLNNPALNIATLEDPIEQHIAGVNQTQLDVDNGVSFHAGLQSLLRQDPNVVMLSHLRDRLAAHAAVDAALNGHLILGGLHTDSAAHGIVHITNIHGEPFMVAATLRLSIGQRFVRRLCPACRLAYEPDVDTQKKLKQWLKGFGVPSIRALHALELKAASEHIGASEPSSFGTTATEIIQLWRADPNGCEHCSFCGFVGQIGTCEVIVNSEAMKKLIAKNPTAEQIQKLAIAEGTLPLQIDGLIKALRGLVPADQLI